MTKDRKDEKKSGKLKRKKSNLAHSYVNPCKLKLHSLEDLVLKRECSNKYVIILSPNKGNETVILNLEIN